MNDFLLQNTTSSPFYDGDEEEEDLSDELPEALVADPYGDDEEEGESDKEEGLSDVNGLDDL